MGFFSKTKDFKILEQINSKSSVKRHIKFVLGCFIIAVSYNLFLAPNKIVAGGVGGLAIIINYLTKNQDEGESIWKSEIFGRSLETIVQEGIQAKLNMMPENTRFKLKETVSKIVNKGSNTLIAIVI